MRLPEPELRDVLEVHGLGATAALPAADDVLDASVRHGYYPLQRQLALSFELVPKDSGARIRSFVAELVYEPAGLAPFRTTRKSYASGRGLHVGRLDSTLAMNAPDKRPLQCRWSIIASVEVDGTDVRWQASGTFKQP